MATSRREFFVGVSLLASSLCIVSVAYAADDVWFHRKCTKCGGVNGSKEKISRDHWEKYQKNSEYQCYLNLFNGQRCNGLVKCELTSPPG